MVSKYMKNSFDLDLKMVQYAEQGADAAAARAFRTSGRVLGSDARYQFTANL